MTASAASALPMPELIVRGQFVRLDTVVPKPGESVPVLCVRSLHVEVQVPLQPETVDALLDALGKAKRAASGLTVASTLPNGRPHP